MPTISKKQVNAHKEHRCEMCESAILPKTKYWRLFGMAEVGDKPYMIRLCKECFKNEN